MENIGKIEVGDDEADEYVIRGANYAEVGILIHLYRIA